MTTRNLLGLSLLGAWVRDAINGRLFNPVFSDDFIIGAASPEYVSGTENKMFFDQSRAAFRAGAISAAANWSDANRGDYSASFGYENRSSGQASLTQGLFNTASGTGSIALGQSNTASGGRSCAVGINNNAGGDNSFVSGNSASAPRLSQRSHSAFDFASVGDAQAIRLVASCSTTNATPVVLTVNQGAVVLTGTATNVLTIPVSRAHRFTINAVARRTDSTSDAGGWTITGTIVRGASGNATFISTPTVVTDLTAGAAAWTLAVTINTTDVTNNYLVITATGQTGATIRWVADIQTAEVG